MGANRVLVDVGTAGLEVIGIENDVVGEASLPGGEFRGEAPGKSALDEVHDLRDGFVVWSDEQVDVVGHEDKRVDFVVAFGAVVLECFEEEFGVCWELEEAATIVGDGRDEEGAGSGGSLRDCHCGEV